MMTIILVLKVPLDGTMRDLVAIVEEIVGGRVITRKKRGDQLG